MAIYNVMLYEITNKILKINVQRTKCQFVQMVFATFSIFSSYYRFLPLARKKLVFAGKNPTLLQGQIGQQASKLLGFIVDVFFANAKKALTNHKWK